MNRIRFGVVIPQGLRGEFRALTGSECAARILSYAHEAEGLGIESAWVYDHFLPASTPGTDPNLEAWTTLAALAPATTAMRLGTIVTSVTFRNPAHLAKIAATVDAFSNGRLEFGMGAGWYELEHRAYGFPFPSAGERARRLGEAIELILELWTGKRVDFAGTYFTAVGAWCSPVPVQKPRPPVWVGGRGEHVTLRVAARLADAWNLSGGTIEEFRVKSRVLSKHCEEVGRDPGTLLRTVEQNCIVLEKERELDRYLSKYRHLAMQEGQDPRNHHLIGTPSQLEERILGYMDAGATYFIVSLPYSLEMLRRFGGEILPRFS